jgi:hypothetical protein
MRLQVIRMRIAGEGGGAKVKSVERRGKAERGHRDVRENCEFVSIRNEPAPCR